MCTLGFDALELFAANAGGLPWINLGHVRVSLVEITSGRPDRAWLIADLLEWAEGVWQPRTWRPSNAMRVGEGED